MSKTTPLNFSTPLGTKSIYMSVTSIDREYSGTRLSWVTEDHASSLNFTRLVGSRDDVLVDDAFGLPIGVITRQIPREISVLLTAPNVLNGGEEVPAVVFGRIIRQVGPRGHCKNSSGQILASFLGGLQLS